MWVMFFFFVEKPGSLFDKLITCFGRGSLGVYLIYHWCYPGDLNFLTFLSPIVGHQQPLKGSLNHPKKVTKNCQDDKV